MSELLQSCDASGRPLGAVTRERAHGDPTVIHLVVHLHVFHPDGRLYLQKRSRSKDLYPGAWDTAVGGHVAAAETVRDALAREAREELGIDTATAVPMHTYLHRNNHESEYVHTWKLVTEGPFTLNREEIEDGRFHTAREIDRHLGDGTFTPNFECEWARIRAPRE